jgi:hypothetical protein
VYRGRAAHWGKLVVFAIPNLLYEVFDFRDYYPVPLRLTVAGFNALDGLLLAKLRGLLPFTNHCFQKFDDSMFACMNLGSLLFGHL